VVSAAGKRNHSCQRQHYRSELQPADTYAYIDAYRDSTADCHYCDRRPLLE